MSKPHTHQTEGILGFKKLAKGFIGILSDITLELKLKKLDLVEFDRILANKDIALYVRWKLMQNQIAKFIGTLLPKEREIIALVVFESRLLRRAKELQVTSKPISEKVHQGPNEQEMTFNKNLVGGYPAGTIAVLASNC